MYLTANIEEKWLLNSKFAKLYIAIKQCLYATANL